jgi:uncharacterized membrane protein
MMFFGLNRTDKKNQPVIKIDWTPIDWILEFLAILGFLTFFGTAIYYFPKLPETIPTHFNGLGQPDGYSSKSSFWILPCISAFVYILLTLVNRFSHKFNYLVTITPQNAQSQYIMGTRMIRFIKMIIVWLFLYINFAIIQGADPQSKGLGLWFMPVFLVVMFIPIIIYFVLSYKKS